MKLISLTICRNSSWCIESAIRHALTYCDHAVVLCHATTDGTQEILAGIPNVTVIEEADGTKWDEMQNRQRTLDLGRKLGGTHFLILDDDEACADPLARRMRGIAEGLKPGQIALMPMVCCWRDLDHYRSDRDHNPFAKLLKSTVFCDAPQLSWKPTNGYQHHHTHPINSHRVRVMPKDGTRWIHWQHAAWPRLVTKQTWYMAMELLRYGRVIANYKNSMSEIGVKRTPIPSTWWTPLKELIDLGAEPWQAADLRRMVAAHGDKKFLDNGIDVTTALNYWKS